MKMLFQYWDGPAYPVLNILRMLVRMYAPGGYKPALLSSDNLELYLRGGGYTLTS